MASSDPKPGRRRGRRRSREVWWDWLIAFLAALGSILGSGVALRQVARHEQQACDQRLDAFREGLDRRDT